MSGIHLDRGAALQALGELLVDGAEQRQHHLSTSPSLPVAALGRDFAAQGQRIAELLLRIHELGTERIDALRTTADAAAGQVRVFGDVDKQLSTDLRGAR